MTEKMLCQNKHKIYIDWETGSLSERPCSNIANKYTVDKYGIFYLCEECYEGDTKRRLDSDKLTIRKDGV